MAIALSFSPKGDYLAYCSVDGVLRLRETSTGILKQEYTPSEHLSALCSCLSWDDTAADQLTSAIRRKKSPRKKKKKSDFTEDSSSFSELGLIAIGTTVGKILIYSTTKARLETELEKGHSDKVNCVSWCRMSNELYSCSEDQSIVRWDVAHSKIVSKWKDDSRSVYSIAVAPNGLTLLSASRAIKLWDVEKKIVLKKFAGHASEVYSLRFVTFPDSPECYFLSAAVGERYLSAWSTDKGVSALATFSASDEVISYDICNPISHSEAIILTAVTKSGSLHMFEHQLNGKCKKPIRPKVTVHVASEAKGSEPPNPIPILSAQICNDDNFNILIAHGSLLRTTFEKISYKLCKPDMCLIRQDTDVYGMQHEVNETKIKEPEIPDEITVLVPGHMVPCQPGQDMRKKAKSKKKLEPTDQLPMEERLDALTIETKGPSRSDNLVHLLLQGLQNKDEEILRTVFQTNDISVIKKTVKRVPVQAVFPMLEWIQSKLNGMEGIKKLLLWLQVILSIHTSYVMTYHDLGNFLSSIYQLMEARSCLYQKMLHLRGRVDFIMANSEQSTSGTAAANEAVLVYQDGDSDDTDAPLDELFHSHSESEDNWEDFSSQDEDGDMEVDQENISNDEEEEGDEEDEGNDNSDSEGENES